MRTHALLLPLLLLAAACAVQTPVTTRYLLPADVPAGSGRVDPPVRFGLARVSVPPYLKDLGLVVETSPGQVRPARLHEWAEPLDTGLRRFLRIEISSALGQEIGSDLAQRASGRPTGCEHRAAEHRWGCAQRDGRRHAR